MLRLLDVFEQGSVEFELKKGRKVRFQFEFEQGELPEDCRVHPLEFEAESLRQKI